MLHAAGGRRLDRIGQQGDEPVAARRRRREGDAHEPAAHDGVGERRPGQHAALLGRQRLPPPLGHPDERGGEYEDGRPEHRLGPQERAHRLRPPSARHGAPGPARPQRPPGQPAEDEHGRHQGPLGQQVGGFGHRRSPFRSRARSGFWR